MFELAYWFCCVGAKPILSLVSRNSRARQFVRKWNHTALRRPKGSRASGPGYPSTSGIRP
jgi:hypothetical protein